MVSTNYGMRFQPFRNETRAKFDPTEMEYVIICVLNISSEVPQSSD